MLNQLSMQQKKAIRNFLQNQLEVIGNLKLSSFVNKKTLSEKFRGKLLESYGLNPKWPLVLYAPTYDAFDGDKFFPDEFKGQYKRLEEYAEFLEKNEFSLMIKFHHFMQHNFKSNNIEKTNFDNFSISTYFSCKSYTKTLFWICT